MAAVLFAVPISAPSRTPAPASIQLVRGHFGGFGTRPTFRRPAIGGVARRTPGRTHRILRHVAHALIFASVLHFLFAGSHGLGFVFLLILIIGLVVLVTRGRRRRRAYQRY